MRAATVLQKYAHSLSIHVHVASDVVVVLDNELGKMIKIMQQCKRVNTSDDKCMDTLFDKVLELDAIMVEGYRGAKANINTLQ